MLLVSDSFNTLMHGGLTCDLVPLLDGQRSLGEIVGALEDRHAAGDVRAAVASLATRGYLVSCGSRHGSIAGGLLVVTRRIAGLGRRTARGLGNLCCR